MNCTKRAFAVAILAGSLASSARADQSTRVIQYHPFEQPTIFCAAGMLCEITLAPGEHITNVWNAQAQLWGSAGSIGNSGATPVITLKPETVGLSANFIVTTDRGRDYHILLQSYNGQRESWPLYTRFAYDDEACLRDRQRARITVARSRSAGGCATGRRCWASR